MSLADEYKQQFQWRSWKRVFDALPQLHGQRVLDLGCGPGDQAAELVARGASVVGVDVNEELLAAARSRNLPRADFMTGDIRSLPPMDGLFDGIWSSFSIAYVPDVPDALRQWVRLLKPGGWIAVTEIDDLFGHEPIPDAAKPLLTAYADDALEAGRYDFRIGRKLATYLSDAGLIVNTVLTLDDAELSFTGAATADVLEAWERRLDRMKLLQAFCGSSYEMVRSALLAALASPAHRSQAKVYCYIATAQGP